MIIKKVYYPKRRNVSLLACSHIRLYPAVINVITTGYFTVRLQGSSQCCLVLTGRAVARSGDFFLDFVTYSISSQYPALLAILGEKLAKQRVVKKLTD